MTAGQFGSVNHTRQGGRIWNSYWAGSRHLSSYYRIWIVNLRLTMPFECGRLGAGAASVGAMSVAPGRGDIADQPHGRLSSWNDGQDIGAGIKQNHSSAFDGLTTRNPAPSRTSALNIRGQGSSSTKRTIEQTSWRGIGISVCERRSCVPRPRRA